MWGKTCLVTPLLLFMLNGDDAYPARRIVERILKSISIYLSTYLSIYLSYLSPYLEDMLTDLRERGGERRWGGGGRERERERERERDQWPLTVNLQPRLVP